MGYPQHPLGCCSEYLGISTRHQVSSHLEYLPWTRGSVLIGQRFEHLVDYYDYTDLDNSLAEVAMCG